MLPAPERGALFTVRQLAERWGVCTATVYGLAKSGKLKTLRIGNSLRATAEDVAEFEEAQRGAQSRRKRRE